MNTKGYMESEMTASIQLSQSRYPAKASNVSILVTGTATAMPAKVPEVVSSVIRDETTMPGWVLLKKFSGSVRM